MGSGFKFDGKSRLAVLTALKKAVDASLQEARRDADESLWDAYEKDGVVKVALRIGDQKVGEMALTFAKDGYEVVDRKAFEAFALDYGLATVKRTIKPDMMESCIKALEGVFDPEVMSEAVQETVEVSGDWEKAMERAGDAVCYMDSGMIVPGVEYRPKKPKNTTVRECDPGVVLPVVAGMPGGIERLLLGGGE